MSAPPKPEHTCCSAFHTPWLPAILGRVAAHMLLMWKSRRSRCTGQHRAARSSLIVSSRHEVKCQAACQAHCAGHHAALEWLVPTENGGASRLTGHPAGFRVRCVSCDCDQSRQVGLGTAGDMAMHGGTDLPRCQPPGMPGHKSGSAGCCTRAQDVDAHESSPKRLCCPGLGPFSLLQVLQADDCLRGD